MFVKYSALTILMATLAIGAPLNINLGAYSPALVVGDGEISFAGAGGEAGAANIVNTLQGAAAGSGGAVAQGAAIAPAAGEASAQNTAQANTNDNGNALQRASVLSEPASLPVPGVTKKDLEPRQDDAEDVEADDEETAEVEEKREEGSLMKRQATGFDRALTFAEAALQKGPKIQLGTPASGVGIIVDNNQTPASAVTVGE